MIADSQPPVARLSSSNDLLEDTAALRREIDSEGYAFFRNVLPHEPLVSLRRRMLELCARAGWVGGGDEVELARAIRTPVNEGEPEYFVVYDELQRLEEFHALAHLPEVMRLMRAILGEYAFPHPLGIARLMFPQNFECTTPPHQDYPNNQGTPDLYACWIPLGDCPVELGGLSILEHSHKHGLLPLEFSLGAGKRQAALDERLAAHRWLSTDFRVGDALVFHSHTVHRSLDNRTRDTLRISCDFRYQREGEALVERSLKPHFERLTWDEIYRDWQGSTPRRYWESRRFRVVSWDESVHPLSEAQIRAAVRQQRAYDARRRGTKPD